MLIEPKRHSDHYGEADCYAGFSREQAQPTRRGIDLFHVKQDTFAGADPALPEVMFMGFTHVAPDYRGAYRYEEGWHDASINRTGDICVVPANTSSEYDLIGSHHLLLAGVPVSVLADAFETEKSVIEEISHLAPCNSCDEDSRIRHAPAFAMLTAMWREAMTGSAAAQLIADSGVIAMTSLMLGHHFVGKQSTLLNLYDVRLTRVIDFIEANLASSLRLDDLAEVACISTYHFTRSFKAATGLTPHSYVLSRRITRAKELLARTSLPLAHIAFEVGFASQSHMTDVFRSRVGTTPASYREKRR